VSSEAVRRDNTAVNERDRESATKTPLDQGENEADRKTTAEIRQKIVNAENMSVNARNVKIITSAGKVTLRGPVNSATEREAIVRFAREVAGETSVDDQLEVASSTTSPSNNP
jgi:osmotically-inducible protein OsmY